MSTQKIVGDQALSALVSDIKSALSEKANTVGEYDSLVSGLANNLKTDKGEINKTPYLFRPSYANGYGYETLIGGTVGVNQLVQNGNFVDTSNWSAINGTLSVSNNIATVTATGDAYLRQDGFKIPANHVCLIRGSLKVNSNVAIINYQGYTQEWASCLNTTSSNVVIVKPSATLARLFCAVVGHTESGDILEYQNINIIDLTAYFGTTIADYVYTLESGTSGAGITWLKNNGFFGADYYPYNAGGLLSVKTSKKINTGFNQWNEQWEQGGYDGNGEKTSWANAIRSKGYIDVIPSSTIYAYFGTTARFFYYWYTSDKQFISMNSINSSGIITVPNDAYFMTFGTNNDYGTTYKHDICINISCDLDGQYQPYVSHEYPLDDIELRGILKLDGNNNLYYDGDTYESNGSVTRKYGIENTDNVNFNYDGGSKWLSGALSGCNTSQTWLPNATFALNYDKVPATDLSSNDRAWTIYNGSLFIKDTSKTENELRAIIADNEIVYELATPTTETADTFTNPMLVDGNGTEEFVDGRTVEMPVGHSTFYLEDLKTKLENAPVFTDISGTLTAGNTSITLSSAKITTNSTIDFYTDKYGVNPTNVTVTNGSITLTFEAQASNLGVKVRVS